MNPLVSIAVYDPRRLDRDAFLAGFVARREFVEFLLDKLRHMPDVAEHHIIVGPRGMGKTSLLLRLAIAIAAEPALRERYIPLTFREEQYNVRSLDTFWRNCAEALAEWCEAEGKKDMAADIDRSLLTPLWRDSRSAVEAFLETARKLGGRPVLFVDNLDLILDALTPEQNWELRRTLQATGGPILFGAATQMLSQSADRGAAFYEFFHPHVLDPLSEAELLQCMSRLAEARGEAGKPVREVLAAEPERIRTLHTLTGGNPRVLTLVYQLLERTESDTVFSDLEVLLDQLTPFYKARVEEYQTDLQRAIIDAIALNWHPITSHDLGEATAVEVTTISPLLNRLKRDGLVEEVQTSGARSGYQLVERFFNIWYLMRHGTRRTRQKVYWLTAFLTSFYAPSELIRMRSESAIQGGSKIHPLYREALEAAGDIWSGQVEKGAPLDSAADEGQLASKESSKTESEARSLVRKGLKLTSQGQSEEAIALYDEVVSRFGRTTEPALQEQVARALVNKGFGLGSLGRTEEAMSVYQHIVTRFEAATDLVLQEGVARALINKGVSLASLGRNEEAISTFESVVSRFEAAEEPALRVQVGGALFNKGARLAAFGQSQDALSVYEDVISRFGTAKEVALRELVLGALFNKGVLLGSLGRIEEEISVYGDIVSRFGAATEPALREGVARALVNKGVRLASAGRTGEAISLYDEVVTKFENAAEPALREQVARALFYKGSRLNSLGRTEEAISVYDNIVAKIASATEPALRHQVAGALFNKGVALASLGRSEEEISIYNDIESRFGDDVEPALRTHVARALVNKGASLDLLGRSQEAISVFDDVVIRFAAAEEPALRQQVARALFNKGVALGSLGRGEEEMSVYDDVVSRFGAAAESLLREEVAGASYNKAATLFSLGRSDEAIAVYEHAIRRFEAAEEPEIRQIVLVARRAAAGALVSRGRIEEAETVWRRAVELDPRDLAAWISLGNMLADHSSRVEEAKAAYRSAISISDTGQIAEANLAWLFVASGRMSDATALRGSLDKLHPVGQGLLDAALEISADNFGAATTHLSEAFTGDQKQLNSTFSDDLLRLLRIAEARGFGEKLIAWFVESGQAEQRAPIYAAFVAYVRGDRFLLDFSPEVRKPAERILRWLSSRRKVERTETPGSQPKRRRGRPPRKRKA
jgi:tetratricopeptide (TPR) repeat protein